MNGPQVLGIDIGGTNLRLGLVDRQGQVEGLQVQPSAVLATGDPIGALQSSIADYVARQGTMPEAVAIGLPSSISRDRQRVYSTPNLPGFDDLEIPGPLSARLGLPVFLERDVNFLLQWDIHQCGLQGLENILGFYVGTGFGNAIYLNGRFYLGKNGVAGELGHIPLYGVEEACPCGNTGCAEVRCSGRALQKLAARHYPGEEMGQLFLRHGQEAPLRQFIQELALPVATEVTLLDPDAVILAGGVVAMPDFPKEMFLDEVLHRVRKPYPAQGLRVLFPEHSKRSGVAGAGLYAFERLQNR
ncbi:allose kinase [Christensenellaceae bacterium NSJ-44]|uniref:Allose kinase n=1 Tax=Luoshenia tenuis TaxID=2763654 RepID=A0A926CYG6_9FIRM|nr:allose kinase [Luoshenia tenuis]MBC8528458.1 allose kinase [Luoshenia tenuis]